MSLDKNQENIATTLEKFHNDFLPKLEDSYAIYIILENIQKWGSGNLFLINLICKISIDNISHIEQGEEEYLIDKTIQEKIIIDWNNNSASEHLSKINQAILSYKDKGRLLSIYGQILLEAKVLIDNSDEQDKLIQLGLVTKKNGKLKVSNGIYASIFSLDWIQQQLPDIAQSSSTGLPSIEDSQTQSSTKLWSGIALLLFLVLVVASSIFRSPENRNLVTPIPTPLPTVSPSPAGLLPNPKDLFDDGMGHGKNGSWLLMLRAFCRIPKDSSESSYFSLAQMQLNQWHDLPIFKEDIRYSLRTFLEEEDDSCPIAEDLVSTFPVTE